MVRNGAALRGKTHYAAIRKSLLVISHIGKMRLPETALTNRSACLLPNITIRQLGLATLKQLR